MTQLGKVIATVDAYNEFVRHEIARARSDETFATELRARWSSAHAAIETTHSPTGTPLPRLALPQTDEPGAIADYLLGQGFPGEFPFANAAYREMYLENRFA